jgi:hypothetical protein
MPAQMKIQMIRMYNIDCTVGGAHTREFSKRAQALSPAELLSASFKFQADPVRQAPSHHQEYFCKILIFAQHLSQHYDIVQKRNDS